jgi:hypothetical protein
MSDENKSFGCLDWLQSIFVGYIIAAGILAAVLGVKSEDLPTWAHLVALLFGIPVMMLVIYFFGGIFSLIKTIFTWLSTILIGILLLVWFVYLDLHLWISFSGLVFLIIGVICAYESRAKESAPWAVNSLGAYFLGLIMIITGIVTLFLHKGT